MKILTFVLSVLVLLSTGCTSTNESDEAKQTSSIDSSAEKSATCEITCPYCGHKKTEILPTEVCQIKYTCEKCDKVITPKDGDCCVFCSYGSHKCPSMQEEK